MGSKKDEAVTCPKCQSPEFERVVSTTNYAMGHAAGQGQAKGVSAQERTCSSGSCKTYTVAGEKRD